MEDDSANQNQVIYSWAGRIGICSSQETTLGVRRARVMIHVRAYITIYSVEIIYIMAIRNNNLTFLTPDKKPVPDTTSKGFSTTAAKPVFKNLRSPETSKY